MRLRDLRKRILSEHGVEIIKTRHRRAIKPAKPPLSRIPRKLKTEKMILLELQHGQAIEQILTSGSQSYIVETYNLNRATVIKWKRDLGLKFSPTNLPPCRGCVDKSIVCQTIGYCHVLVRANADQNTMLTKELEVLNGKA